MSGYSANRFAVALSGFFHAKRWLVLGKASLVPAQYIAGGAQVEGLSAGTAIPVQYVG